MSVQNWTFFRIRQIGRYYLNSFHHIYSLRKECTVWLVRFSNEASFLLRYIQSFCLTVRMQLNVTALCTPTEIKGP